MSTRTTNIAKGVVFIGPTYPFKGGIAQYSSRFFRELKKRANARMVTYTGLYPRWLFPGTSESDPSQSPDAVPEATKALSFVNPMTFRTLGRELDKTEETVILTWWTVAWLPHSFLLASSIRDKSRLILWCHNVIDHDCGLIKKRLIRWALGQATQFVTHTETDARRLLQWFPAADVQTCDLPLLSMPRSAAPQARRTGNSSRLLFFGFVRPYKGLEDLLQALPAVKAKRDIKLTVAGEFWGDTKREIEQLVGRLGLSESVDLLNRYVPNEELHELFTNHDLVVLPYREATGSAVANMAIEYERPLVTTDVGSLPACITEGVNGFLAEHGNIESLANAVLKALDHSFDPADLRQARESRENGWNDLLDAALMTSPGEKGE